MGYCSMLLIVIMLLVFQTRAAAYRSLPQAPAPRIFKLELQRLHIPPAGMLSFAHLQHAMQRSSLRLARFHYQLQLSRCGVRRHLNRSYSTPVVADEVGDFLTTLSIGTPPVSFHLVADTGSNYVWVQCKPCSCFKNNGSNSIFDPSLSSSYSLLPCSNALCATSISQESCATFRRCSYEATYGDKSFTKGDLALETLTLSSLSGTEQHIPNFAFGCGRDNQLVSGSSTGRADGIVGLDLDPLSLPSQLGVSYLSYCLQPLTSPTSKTTSLYLGDVAQVPTRSNGRTLSTLFFTNPVANVTHYYVKLNGISVNGELVQGSSNGAFDIQADGDGGIVFDSGTTFTLIKSDIYNAIVDAFTSAIALPPAFTTPVLCYSYSSHSKIHFPSLTFHFEGANLELPSQNYFKIYEKDKLVCLALRSSGQLNVSIFGNMQQENFFVTHDLKAHTISLTPTTCDP